MTDGTINFVGNEIANNGCKKGRNLILRKTGYLSKGHEYKPQQKHLEIDVKDEEVVFLDHDEKGIIVTKEVLAKMKSLPCFENMKRYVRVE